MYFILHVHVPTITTVYNSHPGGMPIEAVIKRWPANTGPNMDTLQLSNHAVL